MGVIGGHEYKSHFCSTKLGSLAESALGPKRTNHPRAKIRLCSLWSKSGQTIATQRMSALCQKQALAPGSGMHSRLRYYSGSPAAPSARTDSAKLAAPSRTIPPASPLTPPINITDRVFTQPGPIADIDAGSVWQTLNPRYQEPPFIPERVRSVAFSERRYGCSQALTHRRFTRIANSAFGNP